MLATKVSCRIAEHIPSAFFYQAGPPARSRIESVIDLRPEIEKRKRVSVKKEIPITAAFAVLLQSEGDPARALLKRL